MKTIHLVEKTDKDGTLSPAHSVRTACSGMRSSGGYTAQVAFASDGRERLARRATLNELLVLSMTKPSYVRLRGNCPGPWSSIDVSARYQRLHSVHAWQECPYSAATWRRIRQTRFAYARWSLRNLH